MFLKRLLHIVFLLLAMITIKQEVNAVRLPVSGDYRKHLADSIMDKVIFFAPLYEKAVDSYKAELYVKGYANVKKKNGLIRFIPSMFRVRKDERTYLMETFSELHFTSPNIYEQKVKASVGTASEFWKLDGHLPEYFHINIYAATLLNEKLLSPLAPNAKKFYKYHVDSIMGEKHNMSYRIRFIPRNKSYQLVGGYMIVSDHVWSVREIRFAGRSEMLHFNNLVKMGEVGEDDEFLPIHCNIDATFRFLGNVIDADYTAILDYKTIARHDPSKKLRIKRKDKYDLSESYTLRSDTNARQTDTTYFNTLRPLPLLPNEQQLYHAYFSKYDTLNNLLNEKQHRRMQRWGQVSDVLLNRYTIEFSNIGTVRCSPLINPLLLNYSKKNGISYRQEFRYSRLLKGDRLLRVVPRIGYNFKQKMFYWRVKSDFEYWPSKNAGLHLEFGRGNRIYSSDVLDELKAMPDSIFDFSQINLNYFNDLYLKFRHSWEITNGLMLDVGFSMHRRTEVERSRFVLLDPTITINTHSTNVSGGVSKLSPDILRKLRHTYTSFAPRVRLSWTPGQYYYKVGKRKINLHSKYPTLSFDWERGIDGVLGSIGTYERMEFDFSHHMPLGMMRNLYYRLGGGAFTNQKEVYFVDFANFTRSNLPMGWKDEVGGVFQLLSSKWYNSSRKYLRGHLTYEAPFFLIPHVSKYTQHVLNERLYLNALLVPHLNPYVEVGYGIGTHLFDLGIFTSFANWKFKEFGCTFTFELFNR